MLRIQVAGVTILGAPYDLANATGLYVGPGGFEGWEDGGGDSRRESVDRPSQHGEFDLPVFQGSRVVTVDGHALARSAPELGHLRDRIMGICADGSARFVVEHQGQTLWASVRRGAKPTFRDAGIRHGLHRARFMLSLVAADPRKYGEVHDFLGGTVAVNRGNFPARPQLIVSGTAAGGYTVTGPGGRRVVVTKALTSGSPHTIDFAKGGLWVGGVRQLRAITIYQPWEIAPGLPGAVATVNNGASLIQRVTDTYV